MNDRQILWTRDIPLYRNHDTDFYLRTRLALAVLLPAIIGGATEYSVAHSDIPVLEAEGYSSDNQFGVDQTIFMTEDPVLDQNGDFVTEQSEEEEYTLPFVDQRLVRIQDSSDPQEIAATIVATARTIESEFDRPLLIDASIVHPSTLEINYVNGSENLQDDSDTENQSFIASYTVSSSSSGEYSDTELVEEVRDSITDFIDSEGEVDSLLFPQSGDNVTIPYRLDEYTQAYELARRQGFTTVEDLYHHIGNNPDTPVAAELTGEILGVTNDLNRPAIIFTSTLDPSRAPNNGETPQSAPGEVCELQVTPVVKEYEIVKQTERTRTLRALPIGMAFWGLAVFGIRRRTRVIDDIPVPEQNVLDAVEKGTASTLQKLLTYQYRKALTTHPEQQKTGFRLGKMPGAYLAAITTMSLVTMSIIPEGLNQSKDIKLQLETEQLLDEGTIAADSCQPDDLVIMDRGSREEERKTIVTTADKLSPKIITVLKNENDK